ncbi:hypothetical protein PTKIN_Ptkin17bG0059400 [Pterospermum kingtungense]
MSYNSLTSFLCMCIILVTCISRTPIFATESVDTVIFPVRFKVHIINGFADNTNPLILHCHSRDDDLGQHTLWENQEFRFKFIISFIRMTLFYCSFNWRSKSLNNFCVFGNSVQVGTCKQTENCFWKVAEDGIYFSDNNRNWEKKACWL